VSSLFDRRRSERFAELLEEPDGLRRHRLLSGAEAEMDWGVRRMRQLQSMPQGPKPPEEFRDDLRAMLVAAAAQHRNDGEVAANTVTNRATVAHDALAGATQPVRQVTRPHRNPSALRSQAPGTGRTRAAVLVGVTAGALALSGVSAASTDSLPGDPLYQVKRSSERAQLALAASDQTRGQLYLEFAHSRGIEAHQIGHGLLADVLEDMDGETVAGVNLLTTAAVQRGDPNILTPITTFVAQQRGRLDQLHKTLTASGVEPMRRSATLLDSVEQRTHALTRALRKGCAIATVDALGPKPTSC
jgi:hypothetical protein